MQAPARLTSTISQYFPYPAIIFEQFAQKTCQYPEIGLAAQQAFNGPVKGNQFSAHG